MIDLQTTQKRVLHYTHRWWCKHVTLVHWSVGGWNKPGTLQYLQRRKPTKDTLTSSPCFRWRGNSYSYAYCVFWATLLFIYLKTQYMFPLTVALAWKQAKTFFYHVPVFLCAVDQQHRSGSKNSNVVINLLISQKASLPRLPNIKYVCRVALAAEYMH